MAVSNTISVQDMKLYLQGGMTYEQISNKLKTENPTIRRGLSVMNIRRFCKANNIGRNCKLTKEEIRTEIFKCVAEVSILLKFSNLSTFHKLKG